MCQEHETPNKRVDAWLSFQLWPGLPRLPDLFMDEQRELW